MVTLKVKDTSNFQRPDDRSESWVSQCAHGNDSDVVCVSTKEMLFHSLIQNL